MICHDLVRAPRRRQVDRVFHRPLPQYLLPHLPRYLRARRHGRRDPQPGDRDQAGPREPLHLERLLPEGQDGQRRRRAPPQDHPPDAPRRRRRVRRGDLRGGDRGHRRAAERDHRPSRPGRSRLLPRQPDGLLVLDDDVLDGTPRRDWHRQPILGRIGRSKQLPCRHRAPLRQRACRASP